MLSEASPARTATSTITTATPSSQAGPNSPEQLNKAAVPPPPESVNEPVNQQMLETSLLSKIHYMNISEIQMGELAKQRGFSPAVRSFGAMVAEDHSAADRDLAQVAQQDQIIMEHPLYSSNAARQDLENEKVNLEKLKTMTGPIFDLSFARLMKAQHDKTMGDLTDSEYLLQGTRARAYFTRIMPVLEKHDRMASQLAAQAAAKAAE